MLLDGIVEPTVANVPLVGNVTLVLPVKFPVKVKLPENATLPPIVIVLVPLLTPVPPFADGKIPVTPVVKGNPVQLVNVPALGVPIFGVTKTGLVAKTIFPVPVLVVMADNKLALDGVARNVATPVPRPLNPVEIGKPVQFVKTPLDGVPSAGVTKVGDVASTGAPVPV